MCNIICTLIIHKYIAVSKENRVEDTINANNTDLKSLYLIARAHSFKLDTNKCYRMIFGTKRFRKLVSGEFHILIDDKQFQFVDVIKKLRIEIDIKLKFTQHISLLSRLR